MILLIRNTTLIRPKKVTLEEYSFINTTRKSRSRNAHSTSSGFGGLNAPERMSKKENIPQAGSRTADFTIIATWLPCHEGGALFPFYAR